MNILWLAQAETDLEKALDYLIERDPHAAVRLYETIRQKVELLQTQPGLGRPGRVADTRELVIAGTPYIVAHTVDAGQDAVIILRVLTWRAAMAGRSQLTPHAGRNQRPRGIMPSCDT